MAFSYTSGNPDNLVGGQPAAMVDIRGPFTDISTFLNSGVLDPISALKAPVYAANNQTVGEVGVSGQIRAGRQLTATDFTAMGLSVPAGLWNLSDLTDASGNGRALTNKGSVPFGVGINGTATTAAQFAGSTAQALYIADTGGADPFRIKTGSWGCWFRTAKRGTSQYFLAKLSSTAGQRVWGMAVTAGNILQAEIYTDGTISVPAASATDVADDRWHFGVGTFDGTKIRLYVDGALESSATASVIFAGSGPLNIGGFGADGSTAATLPHYGRVDEAFVTADVLTDDQVRNLYCARLSHTLAQVPGDSRILVRRKRRGGALATTDFPATPVRLHNFTAGVLTDQGSGGVTLVTNVGTGVQTPVGGADGTKDGAYSFSGAHTGLSSTDAGLPSGTASRSYGCWLKTTTVAAATAAISWGAGAASAAGEWMGTGGTGGLLTQSVGGQVSGPFIGDGLWHHAVVVQDNAAGDGVKSRLYLDGRLVGGSTVIGSLTLGGANKFRVGASADGSAPWVGQIDGAFVYSGVFTGEQVRALYNVGSQALAASPKDATDHVEAVTTADVLVTLDTIEATDSVDLLVAP